MVLSWYGENRMNRREMGQWRSADQGGGGLARYAIFVAMQRAASHTVPAAWRMGIPPPPVSAFDKCSAQNIFPPRIVNGYTKVSFSWPRNGIFTR